MAVAAPAADKRFRRARVSPARRRGRFGLSWQRVAKSLVIALLLGYALYEGGKLLLLSELLTVSRITVSGTERMARGEVLSLLSGMQGRNMLLLGLEEWRQTLLTSPWVADAALRRVLPGTIDVVISEREPLGIARIRGQLYLIDESGDIIDEFGPNYADLDLPIVDGLSAVPSEQGQLIDPARADLASRLLTELQTRPDLAARVSQIDVADIRDAVLVLDGDPALVRVGREDFVERLQSYLELAPALRERVPEIDSVDLRFGERVYVRPAERRRSGS